MNSKHEPKIVKTTEEKLETRTFFTRQQNKTTKHHRRQVLASKQQNNKTPWGFGTPAE